MHERCFERVVEDKEIIAIFRLYSMKKYPLYTIYERIESQENE
jgi:hypothetical protein